MSILETSVLEKSTIVRSGVVSTPSQPSPGSGTLPQRLGLRLLRSAFALTGRGLPGLAAWGAETLFLTPPRHAAPRRERVWLASAERFPVETGEVGRLTAWSWGEGPPVLLVHGWGGRGGQLGAFAAPLVEAGFRVVTFDAPGHGASGGRRSSLPEMAAAVRAMAGHLGPLAGLVAHSAGAAAVTWVLRSALPVERLVYVAPGVDPTDFTAVFGRMLGVPAAVLERMRRRIETRFDIAWNELNALTAAPSMAAPLLVIHDRFDDETPFARSRELARLWPEARLEVTSGLGHRRILRDPRVVEEAVGFLAEPYTSNVTPWASGSSSPQLRVQVCRRI